MTTTFQQPSVLVVDDDPEVGKALSRLLRSAGHTVECFTSAEELLARHPAPRRGVLILDVRMPGISGPQLQECLIQRGATIPVLFVSAVNDPRIHREVLARGAVGWMTKPLDGDELLARISSILAAAGGAPG